MIRDKFGVENCFIQLQSNLSPVNMVIQRKCKNCPIPGCGSKCLVRLACQLARVHGLTEIERKCWLQFAKLQNTRMIRVYEKNATPKKDLGIDYKSKCRQFNQSVVTMDPRWNHPFPALVAGPTCCGKSQFVKRLLE